MGSWAPQRLAPTAKPNEKGPVSESADRAFQITEESWELGVRWGRVVASGCRVRITRATSGSRGLRLGGRVHVDVGCSTAGHGTQWTGEQVPGDDRQNGQHDQHGDHVDPGGGGAIAAVV